MGGGRVSEPTEYLLPCPFCGERATAHEITWHATLFAGHFFDKPFWQVMCGGCRAAIGDFPDRAEAVAAWNRRSKAWLTAKPRK